MVVLFARLLRYPAWADRRAPEVTSLADYKIYLDRYIRRTAKHATAPPGCEYIELEPGEHSIVVRDYDYRKPDRRETNTIQFTIARSEHLQFLLSIINESLVLQQGYENLLHNATTRHLADFTQPILLCWLTTMDIADRFFKKIHRARLRLKPPILKTALVQFEAESGVSIPEDCREFLLDIANGGSEPCRLVPLSDWCECYWIDEPKPRMVAEQCIITPDAYEQGNNWLAASHVFDWESRWDNNEWDPMFGTIAIAQIGCGLYYSMIMTGPFRGRIFSWGDHALNPPYVYPEPSFADWFENRLDAILAGEPVDFLNGRVR